MGTILYRAGGSKPSVVVVHCRLTMNSFVVAAADSVGCWVQRWAIHCCCRSVAQPSIRWVWHLFSGSVPIFAQGHGRG